MQRFTSGAVRETANSCIVEIDALRREQCYEYIGLEASTDPLGSFDESPDGAIFQTIEFNMPRSFGHDQGFTGVPLETLPLVVQVEGLTGTGLTLATETEELPIVGTGNVSAQFATSLPIGRR